MDVFALFSDKTAEKILLDSFPVRQTEEGLILKTTISSAELKESATTSINNTYLLLEKIFDDIPEKIGVCVYGFSSKITGNSADLAFALTFLAYLSKKGIINSNKRIPLSIAATGTITERLTIEGVGHIREKLLAAVEKKIEAVLYPYDNQNELEELRKTDMEFAAMIKKIRLIPVKSLEDIFVEFGFLKTCLNTTQEKSVHRKILPVLLIASAAICLSVLIIFAVSQTYSWNNNSKDPLDQISGKSYSYEPINSSITPIKISNSPSPSHSETADENAAKSEPLRSPDNIENTASPIKPASSILPTNPQKFAEVTKKDAKDNTNKSSLVKNEDLEIISAIGHTTSNLMNSGFSSSQGDWIYFADYLNVGLYKMKHDGSYLTCLKNAFVTHINVSGNIIYYLDSRSRGLFTIKTDGSGNKKINDDDFGFICIVGDWVYYLNNNDNLIYKVNKNGLDRTPLCNEFKTDFEDLTNTRIYCSGLCVDNNYIYFYAEFENAPDKNGIYSMKPDGSDKSNITQDKCNMLTVVEDYIYFVSSADGGLYRIKKSGSGRKKIYDKVKAFNVANQLIYFSTEEGLFKMNSYGDFISMITDDPTEKINIAADWIYYLNLNDANRLFRIRPNGTEKQPINNR